MWKSFVDCADYEVSDQGEVRRVVRWLPRGRRVPYLLGQRVSNSGYLFVSITVDGKPRNMFVHRMVLRTFVGEQPSSKHEAAHLNGRKPDNALDNLAWASREENAAHKRLHGTAHRADVLSEEAVREMRRLYRDENVSFRTLADRYGVSAPTAHGVVTGRYWSHIGGAVVGKSKGRRTNVTISDVDDNRGRRAL